jgi:uroporphyrinogen decarboxylase
LPFGTPEEVRQETRRVRDLMSRGGGYILAPAQEIQGDVPAENVLALIETAREMACTAAPFPCK